MAQSTFTNQLRLYLIWHLTKYLHLNVFVDKTYQLTFFLEKMDVMICTVDTQGTSVLPLLFKHLTGEAFLLLADFSRNFQQ